MIKVEGHSNLYKKGHAVVNTDRSVLEKVKKKRAEKERLNNIEDRMKRIEALLERLVDEH